MVDGNPSSLEEQKRELRPNYTPMTFEKHSF
jgi:hypothetical protein